MKEVVLRLIEEIEKFEIKDSYWEELKKDTFEELERKNTVDNQYLWLCIKLISEYMTEYTR